MARGVSQANGFFGKWRVAGCGKLTPPPQQPWLVLAGEDLNLIRANLRGWIFQENVS